jgi:peptidyl-prolyl cis-trans isomerase SurA
MAPGAWDADGAAAFGYENVMLRRFLVGLAVALGVSSFATTSHAVIVERVVAIVGERPILLSELRHRAKPHLYRIMTTNPTPAQQAAAESEMFKELLNRMIDDRLEEQAADKAHLTVTPEEVDNALKNIAAGARLDVRQLVAEAKRQGLTEQDYRDEIRRQILEGKLVQLRVKGRVRVTEQDARAAYAHWVKDLGAQSPKDVRILALRIPPGSSPQQIAGVEEQAQQLVLRARSGEDFCKLVAQYSDDLDTKDKCGSRGPLPMQAFIPPIQEAVAQMKEGEVANPIRYANEAVLIVQLHKAESLPSFEQVKAQMYDRAYAEAMDRARKVWLQELRRGVFVESRL